MNLAKNLKILLATYEAIFRNLCTMSIDVLKFLKISMLLVMHRTLKWFHLVQYFIFFTILLTWV